ncbi:MAG TPA: YkvA family protein [Kiloniellaceae bacterium]|nr:YkvA family protein [Kiloniellaceae bacterium]
MEASSNLPVDPRDFARNEARVERGFWSKFKTLAGRLPFAEDLLAAFYCARDPASPRQVRITLMAALAYFVVPSDLIPDVFVSLGFTDDAAVLYVALKTVAGYVTEDHRRQARRVLAETTE